MFKDDITRGRVQKIFQLLHQSSHKDFYNPKGRGKTPRENEKIKHETSLQRKG